MADDSQNVLKDEATAVEWGYDIEVVPIRPPGSTPKVAPSVLPALEALVQATETRVRMEVEDKDSSDNEPPVVKMEVDLPLKMKGKGKAKDPIDLTSSDKDSDKENDRIHPVTIPAVTPTFSSTSRPATSPEVPRDISSSHVPLGSHVIHPRAL